MPYILARAVNTPRNQWLFCKSDEFNKPFDFTTISGETECVYNYFAIGHDRFVPPGDHGKTELSDEFMAQIPTQMIAHDVCNPIPDIIYPGTTPIFSPRVKDKLEELEPGAHDFFPLTIIARKTKKGKVIEEEVLDYYLAYIWQRPDIIDFDRTPFGPKRIGGDEAARKSSYRLPEFFRRGKTMPFYVVNFKEPGYQGRHMWRATKGAKAIQRDYPEYRYFDPMSSRYIFVSDEFEAFMRQEKIRGSSPLKVEEKPIAWVHEEKAKGNI